ncbi:hypothetical protein HGM15179_018224 [Zosterops borbonicus]|uniref:Uncharacterized protein n=1 Tax=Zosterops borbonicus TaxID=364589 RepID=A0A8K1LCF7_9PASS|nr:hypothetical protein HGM15179_018224 [Zosterops borbonicus]
MRTQISCRDSDLEKLRGPAVQEGTPADFGGLVQTIKNYQGRLLRDSRIGFANVDYHICNRNGKAWLEMAHSPRMDFYFTATKKPDTNLDGQLHLHP